MKSLNYLLGLSKFAELKQKWRILVVGKGTHVVCMCTIDENLNIMLDVSNLKELNKNSYPLRYKDCLQLVLCKQSKPSCYLNECKSCPNFDKCSDYITNVNQESVI